MREGAMTLVMIVVVISMQCDTHSIRLQGIFS